VLVNNAGITNAGKPGRPLEEMAKSGLMSVVSLDEVRKRLALLGPDGPTGAFSDENGPVPW